MFRSTLSKSGGIWCSARVARVLEVGHTKTSPLKNHTLVLAALVPKADEPSVFLNFQ